MKYKIIGKAIARKTQKEDGQYKCWSKKNED
jgi:hypothetical protein